MVHYLLTRKSIMKNVTNQANHHGHISEKSDTSSRRASGRSFGTYTVRLLSFRTGIIKSTCVKEIKLLLLIFDIHPF